MCSLLEKKVKFNVDAMCLRAFDMWKRNFIEAPILIPHDYELQYKLMWDANDIVVGAVLGLKKIKFSTQSIMKERPLTLYKLITQ